MFFNLPLLLATAADEEDSHDVVIRTFKSFPNLEVPLRRSDFVTILCLCISLEAPL